MAERANRTLKERLYRYFSAQHTYRWVSVLQRLVSAINRSPCSSLDGIRPVDVNFENASRLRAWLRKKLEKEQRQHPSLRRARFRVGDRVRIEKYKHVFVKGYHPNFTNEVFEVVQVRRGRLLPITYRLMDRDGEVLRGWFYANDLCRVSGELAKDGEQAGEVKEPGALALDEQQQPVYAIERVLKRSTRGGVKQVLVRWRGYDASHDSWIPASSIVNI
jgi:ribosomal protein L21E